MTNLHTRSGELICGSYKQLPLGSHAYIRLLVTTHIIFCGTNHAGWIVQDE